VREEMRGEYFAALQELDQAESSTPYDIRVPLRKARLQLLLGRADKAVAEYRKALKISPNSAEAAEGLKDLEVTKAAESPLQ
jgi:Tfp pilus assembly protein PilF